MELDITGANTLLVTPFTSSGELDLESLAALVESVLAGGVHGVIALGSAGEFFTLDDDERLQVIARVVEIVRGRVPVTVGIGADSTARAAALGRHAQSMGADCVLALPPLYFDQSDRAQLVHFTAIARSVELPVMLYDGAGGVVVSPAVIARVAASAPNVRYVKVATPEPERTAEIIEAAPSVAPLAGDDTLLLAALRNGARGSATAIGNIKPGVIADLHAAHDAGNVHRSRVRYAELAPAVMAVSAPKVEFIARLKAVLHGTGVIKSEAVRSPLHGLSGQAREELLDVVGG
ncbi:dihydrodipicolinate synthase family protein [Saccharothrix sp. ALI-22-I]|uniref:dihydrodipicolinate synthase family protein n=1 Tax=Saccharothrix sp. ALI-22-I TaxID=1933778 RepID=UPI00097CA471|nr:dihydrodipicolinate synthase family protein [Saccharothrix sp. ALI-22-I]